MHTLLEKLAQLCAIAAGLLMTLITLLTCASILGREVLGSTVPGDFELVGLATGAAVGLFMPLCQLHNGNIIVDFFTARAPQKVNAGLDRLGALTLALSFALLTWRSALGGLNAWNTHSGTMLLGVPEWIAYATMVPAFALTALIGLWQCLHGFGRYVRHGHNEEPA
jgi:TRAP-type C4-dicarboxylate transport system permease small subunit